MNELKVPDETNLRHFLSLCYFVSFIVEFARLVVCGSVGLQG